MIDPTRSSQSRHDVTGPAGASAHTPAAAVAPPARRPVAAVVRLLISGVAVVGLVLDVVLSDDLPRLLSYFTVQSNLAVAITFAWSAHRAWTGRAPISPRITGAVLLFISITGLVYNFVLANDSSGFSMTGTDEQTGLRAVSNSCLHVVAPIAVALDWLLLTSPRGFRWSFAAIWMAYPLLYFPFALVRGALISPGADGRYPYPFLDVEQHGYAAVLENAVVFALAFYVLALAVVVIDRFRPGPRVSENRISPTGISPLK
ncbi:Pr6Pr family membrane protein [Streptomyces sp. NPDC003077]|uniref:Pr6Pr family membrane protein n=1 Tax=Streptomyces sp. NPDC003077 TaxID=3154443 RepID=UPI0033AE175F